MSELDTRGFMDGALKGFDVMSRYQSRKFEQERQTKRDSEEDKRYKDQLSLNKQNAAQQQQQHQKEYGYTDDDGVVHKGYRDKESDAKAKKSKTEYGYTDDNGVVHTGLKQLEHESTVQKNKDSSALSKAKIGLAKDQQKLAKAQAEELSRTTQLSQAAAWRKQNERMTEQKWIDSVDGELDEEYFNNPNIKGSEHDIRMWDDKKIESLLGAKEGLQQVLKGELSINAPEMAASLKEVYAPLFQRSVGSKDLVTGKTISSYEYLRADVAEDINPELAGNQPGVTVLGKITFEDGSTVNRPITNNRSSDPNDTVKIIPIEEVMADIAQRSKSARIAAASKNGGRVFKRTSEDKEYLQRKQLNYLTASSALAKEKNKDISALPTPPMQTDVDAINARYKAEEAALEKKYFAGAKSGRGDWGKAAMKWAKGDESPVDDENKSQFLSQLVGKGYNISEVSTEFLDSTYQAYQQALAEKYQYGEFAQQEQPGAAEPNSSEALIHQVLNPPEDEQVTIPQAGLSSATVAPQNAGLSSIKPTYYTGERYQPPLTPIDFSSGIKTKSRAERSRRH